MAQVTRREGKLGVSYTLTANLGRDASGKQIRRHTTYKPPENWSKARQDREAQKAADKFEDGIKKVISLTTDRRSQSLRNMPWNSSGGKEPVKVP